jgi:predicted dehydrogenase
MVKAALIGLGKMGLSHCAILNAHPEVDFVGAVDTSKLLRWGLEKYSSIPIFDDYQVMLEQTQPDCVMVATPTKTHFEIAKACLDNGSSVFLEKPCCLNYADTSQLRELAEKKSLLVQVGYHNRFIGTFRETKRLLDAGAIGPIYHFAAQAYGPVVIKEKEETWRSNRREGGGCLYDYSSHVINLVSYLLGEIHEVRGTRLESIFSKNVEDGVYSTLIMNDGTAGQLAVSWSEESFRKMTTSITISGRNGRIDVDSQELKLYRNSNEADADKRGLQTTYLTDHTPPVNFYLRGEEYSSQIDEFIEKVGSGSTESVNAIRSAGETDRVIELLIADNERIEADVPVARKAPPLQVPGFIERLRFLVNPPRV